MSPEGPLQFKAIIPRTMAGTIVFLIAISEFPQTERVAYLE